MLVRQHQLPGARPHGIFRLGPDPLQPLAQGIRPGISGKRAVEKRHLRPKALHQHVKLAIADERAFQHQNLVLTGVFVQHIAQIAKARLQAHHPAFAQ